MPALLAAALLTLWMMPAGAAQRVTITVNGRFAYEPATWVIVVRLQPDKDDRWLDVIADGTAHYSSTAEQLTGAGARKIRQVTFKELPAGCYDFIAEVRQVGERGPIVARAFEHGALRVMGFEPGDPCGG
jgi:hypothetical protein